MKSQAKALKSRRMTREQRRESIVDAALQTFSRHGFRGATTRRLADAAGVTEVTLFRYFPSKEDLYRAVLDKHSILPVLRAELEKPPPPGGAHDALGEMGRRFLGILKQRHSLIRLMLSEAVVNPSAAQMMFREGPGRFYEGAARLLRQYCERGEMRQVDFDLAARAFLGVFFTFILSQEILQQQDLSSDELDRAADTFVDILWRGLRSEDADPKGGRKQ